MVVQPHGVAGITEATRSASAHTRHMRGSQCGAWILTFGSSGEFLLLPPHSGRKMVNEDGLVQGPAAHLGLGCGGAQAPAQRHVHRTVLTLTDNLLSKGHSQSPRRWMAVVHLATAHTLSRAQ